MSSFRLTITRAARIDIENSAEWYSFQIDDLEKDLNLFDITEVTIIGAK